MNFLPAANWQDAMEEETMINHSIAKLSLASALTVVLATPAWAQNSGSDNGGDIIVTARRVEERLQDVPISITVMNQAQLTEHNVVAAEDLARTTPSLSVNTAFGTDNTSFALRGFSQDIGTSATVGTFFADVVAPRSGGFSTPSGDGAGPGAFFDLQNVQVLKGPQGTLQGRNTTGGAVMLVPQKPTDKLEGYVEGSVGAYNAWGVQAVLNVPVTSGLRLRLGVDRQKRDGYVKNGSSVGPADFDNVNYTAVRASVVADLAPNIENYTIFSYTNSDTHGHVSKLIGAATTGQFGPFGLDQLQRQQAAGLGFYDVFNPVSESRNHTRTWQLINTTTWQASDDLKVKNIVSYAQYRQTFAAALFGTDFVVTPTNGIPALFQALGYSGANPAAFGAIAPQLAGLIGQSFHYAQSNPTPGHDFVSESTFTEELQLQGHAFDSKLTWQAGVYFEKASPLGRGGAQTGTEVNCGDTISTATPVCTSPLTLAQNIYDQYALTHGLTPILLNGGWNTSTYTNALQDTALYAQATYKLAPTVNFTAGFRYTWDKQDTSDNVRFTGFNINLAGPPINNAYYCIATGQPAPLVNGQPNCDASLSGKSSAPTWLVDLDWKPTPDVMVYAKYARGYRAGGVKPDIEAQVTGPVASIGAAGLTPLPGPYTTYTVNFWKPEKVDAYEIGLKSSFHGAISGTFNIAGFYNKFNNQQLLEGFSSLTAPAPGQSSVSNAGSARIYGIEADTSLNLFTGFRLNAAYTYLNTKSTAINPAVPLFGVYAITGTNGLTIVAPSARLNNPLTYSPKNKFTINGEYTLPIDAARYGKITLGVTFTHTDKMYTTFNDSGIPATIVLPNNTLGTTTDAGLVQATNLLDFSASWKNIMGTPVDLSAFVTNVTNQHYYVTISGLLGLGVETGSVGQPRMFGFRLKYHFGD
jgi:iron complex outermembrane recepter protein